MSKSNNDHHGKDRAEEDNARLDRNEETMVSLETIMAALRLVAEQHTTGNTTSSTLRDRDRSPSINTVSSTASTSTTRDASVLVTMEPSSSSERAHEAECAGFQYVDAEERAESNRDEAGPVVAVEQPPSTRWCCIVRGRAVGVFAGWPNTSPLITNMPGCLFQRYPTFNAALNAFMEASTSGHVGIIFI